MGLLDFASGALEYFELDDIVGSFITDFTGGALSGWITDLASGAITNAAVTAIAGGDIGQAALYGAAGGAIGDNLAGAAVRGYGLADANGGNGVLGALAGAGGQYASDNFKSKAPASGSVGTPRANVAQNGSSVTPSISGPAPTAVPASSIQSKLRQYGLVDANGEGTILGKALVEGVAGAAAVRTGEDIREQAQDDALERDRTQMELQHEQEQKRIASFQNPTYRIQR